MALIQKMSIRGIRSFSPERDQVIEFYMPLTMIVGANGCGKTTVIECLKCACTGTLPPGCRNGQTFVHDPKLSDTTEVKANIKLQFKARSGQIMIVVRGFQLTQKKSNLQFKALDNVIRAKGKKGEESMSHKCADLDRGLPAFLGTSKAILENVIFCHQEESNWPLQEGAVVKKKFDDIFEATRYTKALEAIKKTKQEYAAKAKELKVDLAGLAAHLEAAQGYEAEREETREKLDRTTKEIEEYNASLADLEDRTQHYNRMAEQISRLEGQKAQLVATLRTLDVQIEDKERSIQQYVDVSDQELDRLLADFEGTILRHKEDMGRLEEEQTAMDVELGTLSAEKEHYISNRGNLDAQLAALHAAAMDRDALLEQLADKYNLFIAAGGEQPGLAGSTAGSASESSFAPDAVRDFCGALQQQLTNAIEDLNRKRAQHREQEDKLQMELNQLQTEQRTTQATITSKERERSAGQTEISQVSRELQRLGASISKAALDDAVSQATAARRQLQEHIQGDLTGVLIRDIAQIEKQMIGLQVDIEGDADVLKLLNENAAEQNRLAAQQKQVDEDTEQLDARVREARHIFTGLITHALNSGEVHALQSAVEELTEKRAAALSLQRAKQGEHVDLQRTLAERDTLLSQGRREVVRLQGELGALQRPGGALRALKDVLDAVNRDLKKSYTLDDMPQVLEDLKHAEEEALDRMQGMQAFSAMNFWAKLVKQVRKAVKRSEDPVVCPCCARAMNAQERQAMIDQCEAQQKVYGDGKELQKSEAELQTLTQMRSQLSGLMVQWHQWKRLLPLLEQAQSEVSLHEGEVAELQVKLEEAQAELAGLRKSSAALESAMQEALRLRDESNRIEAKRVEAGGLKRRLESFAASSDPRSFREVQDSHQAKMAERDRLQRDLNAKQKQLSTANSKTMQLTNKVHQLEKEEADLRQRLERKQGLDQRRDVLREAETQLTAELNALHSNVTPLRQQLRTKEAERARLRDQIKEQQEAQQRSVNACANDVGTLTRSIDDVERRLKDDVPGKTVKLNEDLANIENRMAVTQENIKIKRTEYQALHTGLHNQTSARTDIENNVRYRRLCKEKAAREVELLELEERIRAVSPDEDVQSQVKEVQSQVLRLIQKRSERRGRVDTIKDQLREIEAKLSGSSYKNVKERHRHKLIEEETTRMAVDDLDKYWTALDKALLTYHAMKIADINKIIRELWQITYTGQDIDMIEIVSGEEGESTKARRSYNYRVVMRKSDTSLDMKGRCSAGQRVLASIVIRLALAETFCINCGILALDEPTTNLDYDNKGGLAHALARIMAVRSKQANFQLVTITHDEDFVTMMHREMSTQANLSMPEFYWRVSREELYRGKFYSRMDRKHWEDLP